VRCLYTVSLYTYPEVDIQREKGDVLREHTHTYTQRKRERQIEGERRVCERERNKIGEIDMCKGKIHIGGIYMYIYIYSLSLTISIYTYI